MKIWLCLALVLSLTMVGNVMAAWSIADPSVPGNRAYIDSIEKQGYWNFPYDPKNPISAAMYCCWWELIYGYNKKYFDALNGASSDTTGAASGSSVETQSYCPSCGIDDIRGFSVDPELQALSDELMLTKPWLREGKSKESTEENPADNSSKASIFSFGDPVKV